MEIHCGWRTQNVSRGFDYLIHPTTTSLALPSHAPHSIPFPIGQVTLTRKLNYVKYFKFNQVKPILENKKAIKIYFQLFSVTSFFYWTGNRVWTFDYYFYHMMQSFIPNNMKQGVSVILRV